MEITVRKNRWQLSLAVLYAVICTTAIFQVSAPVYAKDPLLVIRTEGKDFEEAVTGIRQETEEDFSVNEMIVRRSTGVEEISGKMGAISPKLVVLMDNISISLYKKYQANSGNTVPSVSLMASFTDIAIEGIKNAAGIFYEVPVVTSIVNLRSVMPAVKFRTVGAVYRKFMDPLITINGSYCQKEQIELVKYPIPNKGDTAAELKKGLEILAQKKHVDALWVLNDSVLVNRELLSGVWLPFAREFEKPIIVGVEILVQPRFNFGTFAVIPEHVELGGQAGEMIYDIMDNNWQTEDIGIEQPRSVYKILNLEQAERLFNVDEEQLNIVDKILR
jgi:hypothetical protein